MKTAHRVYMICHDDVISINNFIISKWNMPALQAKLNLYKATESKWNINRCAKQSYTRHVSLWCELCASLTLFPTFGKDSLIKTWKIRAQYFSQAFICNIVHKSICCVFSEDGKFDKEFEHCRVNGNKVVGQLKSHVFNKRELSDGTKLIIRQSSDRILYGSWIE